ncbi:MAG: hypothetical protein GY800_07430 [Planctomycetes bacterium]|nr:hypothetical protein [Planctomycetota bacterium]
MKMVYLAKSLLQLGNIDAPVCAGASTPSIHGNKFPDSFRKMMDDCCGVREKLPVPTKETAPRSATDFIADELNHQENQITILSLGGLTNIAPLLEAVYQVLSDEILMLIIPSPLNICNCNALSGYSQRPGIISINAYNIHASVGVEVELFI